VRHVVGGDPVSRVEPIALEEHELDALLDGIEVSTDRPARKRPSRCAFHAL
jgi:hypothetical protein